MSVRRDGSSVARVRKDLRTLECSLVSPPACLEVMINAYATVTTPVGPVIGIIEIELGSETNEKLAGIFPGRWRGDRWA